MNGRTVLFATHYAGLGGGETSLLNLATATLARGGRPLLACPPGDLQRRAEAAGIRCFPVGLALVRRLGRWAVPVFNPAAAARLAFIIARHGVEVAHAESFPALCHLGPAAFLAGIPCFATGHGYWPLRHRAARWLLALTVDSLHAVSRPVAEELAAAVGPGKVRTIPLGVGADFLADTPGRAEARRQLGLPADRAVVLNVARFEPVKGHANLLDALELLAADGPRPLTLLVGGVLEPAGPTALACREEIARRAAQPPLAGNVRLLGPRDDVALLMRAADVVVVPSEKESFGMTVIEAMAAGTPVVATRCGGPEELINNRITGRLVPPGDPAALAAAVRWVLDCPTRARAMADRARDEARLRYGPGARCELVARDYERLVSARPAARTLALGKETAQ